MDFQVIVSPLVFRIQGPNPSLERASQSTCALKLTCGGDFGCTRIPHPADRAREDGTILSVRGQVYAGSSPQIRLN